MRIGVLSDTHVHTMEEISPLVISAFSGVDLIVHCGDFVGSAVLDGLKRIKEVKAVSGNVDSSKRKRLLPEKEQFSIEGKTIGIEKLDAEAGKNFKFDQVLALGTDKGVELGAPTVAGAVVSAEILEQKKDDKIIIFKKNRRQNYRRKNGHRQQITVVRILDVSGKGEIKKPAAAKKVEAPKVEAKKEAPKAETKKETPKAATPKKETAKKAPASSAAAPKKTTKKED